MNTRHPGSIHLLRTTLVLVIASFLLTAGHASGLAQTDSRPMAVQYFDRMLGNVNLDTAAAIVSQDALLHTPEGSFQGQDGALHFAAGLRGSFSSLEFTIENAAEVGDLVVVRFTMTGTHTGPYLGLQANCAGIAVPGMAILRTSDAGMTEQWIDYDRQTVIEQIHAFSRFDAGEGTACTGGQPIAPSGAPACLSATECETPF